MARSSNPAFRANTFTTTAAPGAPAMTMQGTINKTGILLGMLFIVACYTWNATSTALAMKQPPPMGYLWLGLIGGLVTALIIVFKKEIANIMAPVYAVCEGLLLGSISAIFEARYPGVVSQAMFGTIGVFVAMLLLYRSGTIKVTDKLRMGVIAATGGIFFVYLISMILGFFGVGIPLIHGSGPIGIIFSLVVVGIAAFNLLLDFDLVEQGVRAKAPAYMEWYASFALLVTLVWLYLEILRLLAKLNSRR